MAIDWEFITRLEGHHLKGYVPDPHISESGVTIADGVDLGQMGQSALASLPPALQSLLKPYIGLRRTEAVSVLEQRPLAITETQANILNQAVRAPIIRNLSLHYVRDAARTFERLPDPCQTVLASIAFQYGDPWRRCPRFWAAAVNTDWRCVVHELENFGDAYATRRNAEAAYLKSNLGL